MDRNRPFFKTRITSLALTSNDKHVVSGSMDKTIKIWDVGTQKVRRNILAHDAAVNDVALSPHDRFILSASDDKTVKIIDFRSGDDIFTFREHVEEVSCVAVSADGLQVASISTGAGDGAELIVWDLYDGIVRHRYPTGGDILMRRVRFMPGGKWVVTASAVTRLVLLWDPDTGEYIYLMPGDMASRKEDVDISPDGSLAVSCGDWGEVNLWNLENGEEIFKLYHHNIDFKEPNYWQNPGLLIWNVAFFDNAKSIMSCSHDGTIKLWDTATKNLKWSVDLKKSLTACTISQDGSIIVAGDEEGQLYFIKPDCK